MLILTGFAALGIYDVSGYIIWRQKLKDIFDGSGIFLRGKSFKSIEDLRIFAHIKWCTPLLRNMICFIFSDDEKLLTEEELNCLHKSRIFLITKK